MGSTFPTPVKWRHEEGPVTDDQFQVWSDKRNHLAAFLAEILGTAILGFVVVGVTDARNSGSPGHMAPAIIGMTVAVLICVIAPLTQACFNPARDYGPRLFAYIGGWKEAAIPGPNGIGVVTVYLVAPILGAIGGMGLYHALTRQKAD